MSRLVPTGSIELFEGSSVVLEGVGLEVIWFEWRESVRFAGRIGD